MKQISQEELNRRSAQSKFKEDNIMVTLPKGTKDRILAYADNFSRYAREVILKDLDRRDKKKDKDLLK